MLKSFQGHQLVQTQVEFVSTMKREAAKLECAACFVADISQSPK